MLSPHTTGAPLLDDELLDDELLDELALLEALLLEDDVPALEVEPVAVVVVPVPGSVPPSP